MAGAGRRAISLGGADVVCIEPLSSVAVLPALMQPAVDGVDLAYWAGTHREQLDALLLEHGGVLCRGFTIADTEAFERIIAAAFGGLMPYTYRSTPRRSVSGHIYTSTEYPPEYDIPLHNEMSYTRCWPLKIGFWCRQAAEEGGETPIADSRAVYRRMPAEIREAFASRGVRYIRNYDRRIDLPWQEVFQTDDRAEVDRICRGQGIELEWRSDDRLRTTQTCQGVATHPVTGTPVWFNQAHLFHVSRLDEEMQQALRGAFAPGEQARYACFGDGAAISEDMFAAIRAAYDHETITFPWQTGDLLLLDNMLAAHGRRAYRGARSVLVGMADPYPTSTPAPLAS